MFYWLLAGFGLYALIGVSFGFDGLFTVLGVVLVALWIVGIVSSINARRHRYDGIDTQGRQRKRAV